MMRKDSAMKRRLRPILLSALAGVLLLGGAIFRVVHQELLNNALIAALIENDLDQARAALKAGADGNARYNVYGVPHSPIALLKKLLPHAKTPADHQQPALLLYLDQQLAFISPLGSESAHGRGKDDPLLVKAMLDAGADINAQDVSSGSNWTPLRLAARGNLPQTVRLLAARGANINQKDAFGETPLEDAVRYGDTEDVQVLLNAGAEIDPRDSQKFTPLHYACMEGHFPAATLLMQHHADPNSQNIGGMSPFQYAVDNHDDKMVAMMLLYHPNVNLRDKNGQTALDMAQRDYPLPADADGAIPLRRVVALLKKAGAKTGKELSGTQH